MSRQSPRRERRRQRGAGTAATQSAQAPAACGNPPLAPPNLFTPSSRHAILPALVLVTSQTGVAMTPAEFIAKWSRTSLPERAASQEHFLDLCHILDQPTPAEHDATGAEYAFEKGVAVTDAASAGAKGDRGYADAWWRGKFAWEYKRKGKYKDLREAYRQLCQYREALENPPLLVVCDIARTEIHTNFTGTVKAVHEIELAELDRPERLKLLRRVFTDPASFRPDVTKEQVTRDAAKQIGLIAQTDGTEVSSSLLTRFPTTSFASLVAVVSLCIGRRNRPPPGYTGFPLDAHPAMQYAVGHIRKEPPHVSSWALARALQLADGPWYHRQALLHN